MYDNMSIEARRANWGWWGEPWRSGICLKSDVNGNDLQPEEWDWDMNVPTPVGTPCISCQEEIKEGDRGQMTPYIDAEGKPHQSAQHRECAFRAVMGGLAHQERRCSCFGGDGHDTPGMTARQEAIEVWKRITGHE